LESEACLDAPTLVHDSGVDALEVYFADSVFENTDGLYEMDLD
jgi:hypothetical protein